MSLKTERIKTQILREVSLILQNEVRDRDLRMCTITAVKQLMIYLFLKCMLLF